MSVERDEGEIVFTCDSCPEELNTETDDFSDARRALRLAGWTAKQVRGLWVHTCALCEAKTGFYPVGDE